MNKQSILIVHNYYQIPGGEDTVVANEKKILEDNGHKVVLYTRNNNEIKTMNAFQKILLPFTSIYSFKTAREIKKIIKEENIDIVHVHNTLSLISPSVYYAAVKMNKPVVQTIHNFRMLCPGATFYRDGHICEDCVSKGLRCSLKHKCYRNSFIQTLVCVISTKIHRTTGIYSKINYICLTEFNKNKLLQLKQIKPKRVFVKPNFTKNNGKILIDTHNTQRKNQFIFIGRLEQIKGIDFLLDVWKELGDAASKLIVCGIGSLENYCKEYISKYKLNIEMKGLVSNEEVKELVSESLALIMPTMWYEGFPMTIVEAFSVGTPVICPSMGNVGNLVEDGITGYKYNDKNELEQIIENKNMNLTQSVQEIYNNRYTEAMNYNKLSEIYTEVSK